MSWYKSFTTIYNKLTFSLTIVFNHLTTLYFPQVVKSLCKLHSIWHFWTKRFVALSNVNEWVRREQIINRTNIQHDIWAILGPPFLQDHLITWKFPHFIMQINNFNFALLILIVSINWFIYFIADDDDQLSGAELSYSHYRSRIVWIVEMSRTKRKRKGESSVIN